MSDNATKKSEQNLDVGKFKIGVGSVITSTPAYADLASLSWDNIGLLEKGDGTSLTYNSETLEYVDSTPSSTVYETIISEGLNIETMISEISLSNLLAVFNADATHTNGSVATTVATSASNSTTKIKVTALTGMVVGMPIQLPNEKPVMIKAIYTATTEIEFIEPLSAIPADAAAVKDVLVSDFVIGGKSSPKYMSIKLEKEMPIAKKKLIVIIPKASISSQFKLDTDHDAKVKMPYAAKAIQQTGVIDNGLAKVFIVNTAL